MAKYYKPSGKFSPISFIYFILTALIVLPILALVYTYLVWYIPFVYINLFITIGFGFTIGFAISFLAIKFGKVRNSTIALTLGLIGGLIALYFSWAIWVDLVINAGENYGNSRIGITASSTRFSQLFRLVLNPKILMEIIAEINSIGTWGIGSSTVSGVFLTIIWVIEALIIIVITTVMSYTAAKIPFCELDNKWFDVNNDLPAFSYIENPTEMINLLERLNPNSFEHLAIIKDIENNSHSIFSLYTSSHRDSYLSIENKLAKTNDKGEVEFDDNEFIEYIYINNELKDKLLAIQNINSKY